MKTLEEKIEIVLAGYIMDIAQGHLTNDSGWQFKNSDKLMPEILEACSETIDEIINRPDPGRGGDEIVSELLESIRDARSMVKSLHGSITNGYTLDSKKDLLIELQSQEGRLTNKLNFYKEKYGRH